MSANALFQLSGRPARRSSLSSIPSSLPLLAASPGKFGQGLGDRDAAVGRHLQLIREGRPSPAKMVNGRAPRDVFIDEGPAGVAATHFSWLLQELPRHEARGMVMVAEGLGQLWRRSCQGDCVQSRDGRGVPSATRPSPPQTICAALVGELQSLEHARPTARAYDPPIMGRCTILGAGKLTSSPNAWPICPVSHCI